MCGKCADVSGFVHLGPLCQTADDANLTEHYNLTQPIRRAHPPQGLSTLESPW